MQLGTPQVPFYVLKPCWRWNLGSAFFYLSRCCPRLAPQRSKKKNRAVMTVQDQTAALGPRSIEERSISDLETNQRSQQRNCQTRCNLTPSGWIRIQNLCAQFGASTEHRSWIWITCGSFAASAATREVQPFTLFQQMLQEIVKKYGLELRLVLAWDEAVPGNILQPDSFFADQVS